MKFHEKSLELNITHELLSLTDSWYWFLTDIPLWRYWRPKQRLPFLKFPKSTSGGFHITSEGKSDSSGEEGGGYDVRIKSGLGKYLLFIQYKLGDLIATSPDPKSIFDTPPHDHYKFKINSTTTNQHFLLRELANGIGKKQGNAVVYAFPLIKDMNDLENNAGKLIRRTKFISIQDLDDQAKLNNVSFAKNKEHNFRVGQDNMNRCEVNYYYYSFTGKDKAPELIADIVALSFNKSLTFFINEIEIRYQKNINLYYFPGGLRRAFGQYLKYLLHHFEVAPSSLTEVSRKLYDEFINLKFPKNEFSEYQSTSRDIEIVSAVFNALSTFKEYILNPIQSDSFLNRNIPIYTPTLFIFNEGDSGFEIKIGQDFNLEDMDSINYIVV